MDDGDVVCQEPGRPADLRAALAELDRLLLDDPGIAELLGDLCAIAAGIVSGAHSGFLLERGGQPVTVAGNDGVVARLDEIQHEQGQGPVLDAVRTCAATDMPSLADDHRWGDFGVRAVAVGVASGLCLPLVVDGTAIGALSLYAPAPAAFTDLHRRHAQAVAGEAAGGLALALRRSRHVAVDEPLRDALATRQVIDRALGVLMHARRVSSSDALEVLLDMSRASNQAPGDVAAAIVRDAGPEPGRG